MSTRKYSRLYRDMANEYAEVYDDAETLGTYMQLLVDADGLWPMHPTIGRRIKDGPLKKLTDAGLVILEERDRYAIKGLDKLRQSESEQGRQNIAKRWDRDPNRGPNRDPNTGPSTTRREETRREETKRAGARGSSKMTGENGTTLTHIADSMPDIQPSELLERLRHEVATTNVSEGTATVEVI